jgi:hypothetical protein
VALAVKDPDLHHLAGLYPDSLVRTASVTSPATGLYRRAD